MAVTSGRSRSAAVISEVSAAVTSVGSVTLEARTFRRLPRRPLGHAFRRQALRRRALRSLRGSHFGGHFGGGTSAAATSPLGGRRFGHANLAGQRFGGAGSLGGRTAFAHNGFGGRGLANSTASTASTPTGSIATPSAAWPRWNAWGNNYWGAGWNDWGSGWGYWAGPVFWPFFFGDALTFALWPYAFYDPFFAYGPDLLLTSIFWPGPLFSPYYAYNPYYYGENSLFNIYGNAPYANGYASYGYYEGRHHRHHHRLYAARSVAHANLEAGSNSALTCGGLAPGVVSLPIDQIERAIRPTEYAGCNAGRSQGGVRTG